MKHLHVFLLLLSLCLSSALIDGCGSTPATKLAQGEKVLITSVNVAVRQVVIAINAGKLTQKQCDTFKKYYVDYTEAQKVAKAAILKLNAAQPGATTADADAANNAVQEAETVLLSFINSVL
jgi:hypothetical protein